MPTGHQCHGHVAHAELASVIVRSVRGHLWAYGSTSKDSKSKRSTESTGPFSCLSMHPLSDVHVYGVYGHGRNSANSCKATRQMALKMICSRAEPMRNAQKKHFQFLDNILPPGFSKFTLTSRQLRSSFCAYRNIRHNKCLKLKVTRRIGNSVGNQKIGRTRIILDLSTPDSWFFC